MVKKLLPPGFRFHPTDVELILYYLKRMILGKKFHYKAIAEVNIYKYSPWDLPDKSCLKTKDLEWFFFCPREKKYQSGVRVKRATENGYWKTTGKDRIISFNEKTIGTVKTLIFHLGHAPQGERTNWVIHEYKILDDQLAKDGLQDNYVLCKLFEKNGLGPKNGAQYGAPFNEADWSDDDDDDGAQDCPISLAADPCPTVFMQNEEQSLPLGCCFGTGNGSPPIVVEGPLSSTVAPTCIVAVNDNNDEMSHLLNSIVDEDMPLPNGFGLNEDDLIGNGMNILHPCEGWNIYNGLHDLDSWTEMHECGIDLSGVQNVDYSLNSMLPEDNSNYIELNDLLLPLDCSNGVTRAHIPSLCQTSVSYGHGNIQEVYSGTFAGMDQCTSFVNDLAVLPDTSEVDNSLNVLQTGEFPFYQGSNSSYNLDFPFVELENAFYSPQDMERGSNLENRYSRFMECVPAQLPSAAELLALKYSPCGGSSIHIKAEVTHGAGECTNEALSVMMEGSSSCWCNLLFRKVQPWAVEVLLNLVEFISDLIMVNCLIEAVSSSYHFYIRNESPSYSPRQPKLVISLNHLFVCYYYN